MCMCMCVDGGGAFKVWVSLSLSVCVGWWVFVCVCVRVSLGVCVCMGLEVCVDGGGGPSRCVRALVVCIYVRDQVLLFLVFSRTIFLKPEIVLEKSYFSEFSLSQNRGKKYCDFLPSQKKSYLCFQS